jgi:hypothetical protein
MAAAGLVLPEKSGATCAAGATQVLIIKATALRGSGPENRSKL